MSDEIPERHDAYSRYETVFDEVHSQINSAVRAWSHVQAADSQGVGLPPGSAVGAKRALATAAARLSPQVRRNSHVDVLGDIDDRWHGEDGYMDRLESVDLRAEAPGWLGRMVDDMLEAGFELGYLDAGRDVSEPQTPEQEAEAQVKQMFE